jgi:hypothetical protein
MNANELANKLDLGYFDWAYEASFMLRQQAKEIEELKADLEDCTCQGGHSDAYLKVKGK